MERETVAEGALLGRHTLPTRARRVPNVGLVDARKSNPPRTSDSSIRGCVPASERHEWEAMKGHTFTLILAGVSDVTPELADAVFEATNGDVEFAMRNGVAFLEVTRAAPTLRDAITAVICEVETAGIGVRVVRVETEVANTVAKINADLLGAPSPP